MENSFSNTIGLLATGGAVVGSAVVGILYVLGIFKKTKDGEDDRLIKILQNTVDALKEQQENDHKSNTTKICELEKRSGEEIETLTREVNELTEEVKELRIENKALANVLQGRDDETQKFFKEATEAMRITSETNGLVRVLAEGQNALIGIASRFLEPSDVEQIRNAAKLAATK